jgi:PhzF family phenazine biosynthesis protein
MRFCVQSDIDIIEVFTSDVTDNHNMYRVRVFAPKFGYLEDPATGSGNSAFGYYLVKNNKFDRETITVEQNGDIHRFNSVKLRKDLDTEKNVRILFGGSAIKRIEGNYFLY